MWSVTKIKFLISPASKKAWPIPFDSLEVCNQFYEELEHGWRLKSAIYQKQIERFFLNRNHEKIFRRFFTTLKLCSKSC